MHGIDHDVIPSDITALIQLMVPREHTPMKGDIQFPAICVIAWIDKFCI